MATSNYRPEIDGLRALAVFCVVLYHAKLQLFSKPLFAGGYFGVDIFFVISGYLIGRILVKELQDQNKIDLGNFYIRRIRRILPMLLLTLLVSSVIAHISLPPRLLLDFAKSSISATFFFSNFHFYSAAIEYAAQNSLYLPLLHTWSLGVEEQFYIVLPLALLFCKDLRVILIFLLVVTAFSFGHAVFMTNNNEALSFYSTPTRFWELTLGVLIAIFELSGRRVHTSKGVLSTLQIVSLAGIVYAVTFWGHGTPHPGMATLFIGFCTGTILIVTNKQDFLGGLLSFSLFNYLGKLSFSIYLWHFPIFAFARIHGLFSSDILKITAVTITIILSVASYHFFETPIRKTWGNKSAFATIGILFATVIFYNLLAIHSVGFPHRMHEVYSEEAQRYNAAVLTGSSAKAKSENIVDEKSIVVILGDSYLQNWSVLTPAISDKYEVVEASYLGCIFSISEENRVFLDGVVQGSSERDCLFTKKTLNHLLSEGRIEDTILVSHRPFSYEQNLFRFDLLRALQASGSKKNDVLIVGNYFQLDPTKYRSCLELMFLRKAADASICLRNSTGYNQHIKQKELTNPKHFFDGVDYTYLDLFELMRNEDGSFEYQHNGVPFMLDWNHLTPSFVYSVIQRVQQYNGTSQGAHKLKRLLH